jgi:hypothetical protein
MQTFLSNSLSHIPDLTEKFINLNRILEIKVLNIRLFITQTFYYKICQTVKLSLNRT